MLLKTEEVCSSLHLPEYSVIRRNYDWVTKAHYQFAMLDTLQSILIVFDLNVMLTSDGQIKITPSNDWARSRSRLNHLYTYAYPGRENPAGTDAIVCQYIVAKCLGHVIGLYGFPSAEHIFRKKLLTKMRGAI